MPARNIYHDDVLEALTADGWTITDDPLSIGFGTKDLFVDLGAEKTTLGAERGGVRIAVEIQSFLNRSSVRDLQEAVGQYAVYRLVLAQQDPDRRLYMAIPRHVYEGIFSDRFGQLIVAGMQIRLLVFSTRPGRVLQWIG